MTWASPGAAWILAATTAEITGETLDRFFTPEDCVLGIPRYEVRTARAQGSSDDDRWMLRADGSRFWAGGRTVALSRRDGTPLGMLKIFRDLSDIKMRIDTIDHRGHDAAGDATDAGGLAPTIAPLVLQAELTEAVKTAEQRAPRGARALDLLLPEGAPVTFEGDPAGIREVFALLVGNALRFTPDDGHIWISATVEGQQVVVRIEDNGGGIDAATLHAIAGLLTGAAPATSSGSRLARVSAIVARHRGSVQARSAGPGKGSQFTVRLPLRQASTVVASA